MSKKTQEATFYGKGHIGGVLFDSMEDVSKFCQEHIGEDLTISITPTVKTSKKMQMYRYWFAAIVPAAMLCFREAGYTGVDKIKADFMLRSELARDYVTRPDGEFIIVTMDKRDMTKVRLHQLISDAVWFLEEQFGYHVPSGEEWKIAKLTGINFKPVK